MKKEVDYLTFIITLILGIILGILLCLNVIFDLKKEIEIKDEFIGIQRIVIEKYNNHSGG